MPRTAVVPHVVIQHGARHLQHARLRFTHGGGLPLPGLMAFCPCRPARARNLIAASLRPESPANATRAAAVTVSDRVPVSSPAKARLPPNHRVDRIRRRPPLPGGEPPRRTGQRAPRPEVLAGR